MPQLDLKFILKNVAQISQNAKDRNVTVNVPRVVSLIDSWNTLKVRNKYANKNIESHARLLLNRKTPKPIEENETNLPTSLKVSKEDGNDIRSTDSLFDKIRVCLKRRETNSFSLEKRNETLALLWNWRWRRPMTRC